MSLRPRQHATHQDIKWHKRWFVFTIKYSKTNQLGRGTEIHLKQTGRSTCPHTAMKCYLQECQGAPTATPPPHGQGRHRLTPSSFRYHLCQLIRQAGYQPHCFNTHSLRIGAATSAAIAGASSRRIQQLGRWRSQAFRAYICQPPDDPLQV